jgi:hypothetical protein
MSYGVRRNEHRTNEVLLLKWCAVRRFVCIRRNNGEQRSRISLTIKEALFYECVGAVLCMYSKKKNETPWP